MVKLIRNTSLIFVLTLIISLNGCHATPAYSKVIEDRYPYEFWMRVPIATESAAYDSIVIDFYVSDSPLDSGAPAIYTEKIDLLWRVEKKLNAKVTGEVQYQILKIKLGRVNDGLQQLHPDPAKTLKRPKLGSGALICRIIYNSKDKSEIFSSGYNIDSGLLAYQRRVYIPKEAYEDVEWVHETW